MAKAKKKTVKKKKTIKKKKKIIVVQTDERELRKALETKRLQVLQMLPEIPCTGEQTLEGETIHFTEAEKVRELYYEAFQTVRLSVSPVAAPHMMPQISFQGRLVAIVGCYEITDIDTGYSVIGWGAGLGINADWAGNTAQTRAMKQFLLGSFMTNWKDPATATGEAIHNFLNVGDYMMLNKEQRKELQNGDASRKPDSDIGAKGRTNSKAVSRRRKRVGRKGKSR